jgi:hypothetical protein
LRKAPHHKTFDNEILGPAQETTQTARPSGIVCARRRSKGHRERRIGSGALDQFVRYEVGVRD